VSVPARLADAPAPPSGPPTLMWRRAAVLICVLYTPLTVTSSSLALPRGLGTDTHLHLPARCAITLGFTTSYLAVAGLLLATTRWRRRHTN